MIEKLTNHRIAALLVVFLFVFSAGCNGAAKTPAATPTPEATAVPPTPTPAPAEIVWVDAQGDANSALAAVVSEFAAANALQYRTVTALDASGINLGTRIVVFASAPENLTALAAASPATQFAVLGSSSTSVQANISVVQTSPADEAFMAGYLTMLIAEDWRAAGLLPSDSALGDSYADAFTNGARFVCGKCNPFYAPLVDLPLVTSVPTGTDTNTLLIAISTLTANWLSSAFIDPAFVNADTVTTMNTQAFNWESVALISTVDAPQDSGASWAALLSSDASASLKLLLPQLLAGQGGLNLKAQITLTSINEDIVTPAKQTLFNKIASDLAADQIIPLSVR